MHPNGLPTGGSVLVYLIMFLIDHKKTNVLMLRSNQSNAYLMIKSLTFYF